MSSLVRRIQKKIARSQGYYRSRVDGKIHNSDQEPVGYRWPQVAAPTSKKEAERLVNKAVHKLDRLEKQNAA